MTKEETYVLAGVKLLNEKIPGWELMIDWDVLDIWDTGHCIIGQLRSKLDEHIFDFLGLPNGFFGSRIYGFDVQGGSDPKDYAAINAAWDSWRNGNLA